MADPSEGELRAEASKLGPNAEQRIRAVENYITAQVGSDLAKDINGRLVTAKQIEGWERIIANARTQQRAASTAATPTSSQQTASGQRVTDEQWAKMSPATRLDYCRQFDQSKF
jgi:hypothetical protein